MTYLPRHLNDRLIRMVAHFPVVVVAGARQVGKTTWLEHALPDWDRVTLDATVDVEGARRDPDLFLRNRPSPLVIDEVQYAPELVAALKRAVDRDRRAGRFVLTGSQQWQVLKGLSESLAGRAVFLHLEGFSLAERAEVSGRSWLSRWLEAPGEPPGRHRLALHETPHELLWRGSMPEPALLPLDLVPDWHAGYRRTYIERDVRQIRSIEDAQLFGRFFGLVASQTAQEINHTQLGRELGIARTTAQQWLALLVGTWQWFEVPAWSGNAAKRLSNKPKGYIADTGLACTAQLISTPTALGNHPLQGALFETAVVAEIRKLCAGMSPSPRLWHWRSHGGAEVDLVLERDGRLFPIEVKAATAPRRRSVQGLTSFAKTYGDAVAPGLVVSLCDRPYALSADTWAIPWDLAPTPQSVP